MTKDKAELLEFQTLKKCEEALLQNIPLRRLDLSKEERQILKAFALLL